MLEKPAGSADEDVHEMDLLLLVLEILASDEQALRKLMFVTDALQNFEHLNSQLSSRHQHYAPCSIQRGVLL